MVSCMPWTLFSTFATISIVISDGPPLTVNAFAIAPSSSPLMKSARIASTAMDFSADDSPPGGNGGIYRPFSSYAWDRLISSGLVEKAEVPPHLAHNSSPAKGSPEGSTVRIQVESAAPSSSGPMRLGRYALLETIGPGPEFDSVENGIHVLNLVLFPTVKLPLPVLGMDLVTLPGGKNLIAIDFQPILERTDQATLFPPRYVKYEERIRDLFERHVVQQSEILPWGGDIPPAASRFFSPYALWTRLQGEGALSTIRNEVYSAFRDYLDLYLEIMQEVSADENESDDQGCLEDIRRGHEDYLNYRKDNDPARPMLNRLYGQEYTEEVILNVLFQKME